MSTAGWHMNTLTVSPYYPERQNGWSGFMGFTSNNCTGVTALKKIDGWEVRRDAKLTFKSFMIPPKTEVTVFKDAMWDTQVGTYYGMYDDVKWGEMPCIKVAGGSIWATRKDHVEVEETITAYWKLIGSGMNFSRSVTASATNSSGNSMSNTESENFTASMNSGLSLEGFSAGVSASTSLSNSLTSSISSTLSSGTSVTMTQSCK